MSLPCADDTASIAVRCCPALFKLRNSEGSAVVALPYRMVFAVASLGAVTLYDTEQPYPIAMIANLHYDKLTDVAWCVACRVSCCLRVCVWVGAGLACTVVSLGFGSASLGGSDRSVLCCLRCPLGHLVARAPQARMLMMSSIDGYCSVVLFDEGELGEVITPAAPVVDNTVAAPVAVPVPAAVAVAAAVPVAAMPAPAVVAPELVPAAV